MSSANPWLLLGAAIMGVVGVVTVAITEYFRNKQLRITYRDVKKAKWEISRLRQELDALKALQNQNNTKNKEVRANRSRSISSQDVSSVTSDEEFYDCDSDVTESLQQVLKDVDKVLEDGTLTDIKLVLERLTESVDLDDPEIFWRIGKAHYKISEKTSDANQCKMHLNKGVEACRQAIAIDSQSVDGHKWYAILVGARSKHQSLRERINDGSLFKKHVEIALELNPHDHTLHYLHGRYAFSIAELSWLEKKGAATLGAELPPLTHSDALQYFLEAERLVERENKEYMLMIAKCYIALKDYKTAVEWLTKANAISTNGNIDDDVDSEIRSLLSSYNSYR